MLNRYLLLLTLLFLGACRQARQPDPDELVLADWVFEEQGHYYRVNCADHSAREPYTGTDSCYYDNGRVKGTYTIVDGRPDGHWEQFNADGSKKLDLYYDNGVLQRKIKAR
jgi:hypothetical protein